ncbi:MAG: phosphoglucosamine mutase [Magnetococcales bacterium]|nr:phosphoglucosamine mutase [Magnetococcales bacterium]
MTSSRHFFGTDGIRGPVNLHPMTAEFALHLAMATATVLRRTIPVPTVVIGMDTRRSGPMLESALVAGFTSMGVHCLQVGVVPTPALAYLTRHLKADTGVMISASHNPYRDNGLKLFDPSGMKLPDSVEATIEALLHEPDFTLPPGEEIGEDSHVEQAAEHYRKFCQELFPRNLSLKGLRIVVDCAHGASYRIAPKVLENLGAELILHGTLPNGRNINDKVGSLHPEVISQGVVAHGAHLGIAFDGDADRVILCDEKGRVLDGDHILAICGLEMKKRGTLKGGGIVATVMSNLGLEKLMQHHGLRLVRAAVGDRYVLEAMLQGGYNLGGEQSGHLLFLDRNSTGDGLMSALQVLEIMAGSGRSLGELASCLVTYPQILKNVRFSNGVDPMGDERVQEAIREVESDLGEEGRVLVRKSGTEPKIRVMLEGDNQERIEELAERICEVVRQVAG